MIRVIVAIAVIVLGINIGARFQVFNEAKLASRDQPQTVYVGQVSRTLLQGDWVIDQADGWRVTIPDSNFGVLVAPSSGVTFASVVVVLAAVVIGVGVLVAGSRDALAELRRVSTSR